MNANDHDALQNASRTSKPQSELVCPHCSSKHFVLNGHSRGRQRYLCHSCSRTFGEQITRKPSSIRLKAAYERFLNLWPQRHSVRTAAEATGASPSTIFRWRHRLLGQLSDVETPCSPKWQGQVGFSTSFLYKTPSSEYMSFHISHHNLRTPLVGRYASDWVEVLHMGVFTQEGITQQYTFIPDWDAGQAGKRIYLQKWLGPDVKVMHPGSIQCESYVSQRGRRLTRALQVIFRKWLRFFRGIHIDNVFRYVAWYNRWFTYMYRPNTVAAT